MKCSELDPHLSALRDGDLDPALRAELDAHLGACPSCRRQRRQFDRALGALHDLPPRPVPASLRRRVLELVDAEAALADLPRGADDSLPAAAGGSSRAASASAGRSPWLRVAASFLFGSLLVAASVGLTARGYREEQRRVLGGLTGAISKLDRALADVAARQTDLGATVAGLSRELATVEARSRALEGRARDLQQAVEEQRAELAQLVSERRSGLAWRERIEALERLAAGLREQLVSWARRAEGSRNLTDGIERLRRDVEARLLALESRSVARAAPAVEATVPPARRLAAEEPAVRVLLGEDGALRLAYSPEDPAAIDELFRHHLPSRSPSSTRRRAPRRRTSSASPTRFRRTGRSTSGGRSRASTAGSG